MRRKAHQGSQRVRRTFRQRNVKFAFGITLLFVLGLLASGAFGQVMDTVTGTDTTAATDTTSAPTTDTTDASSTSTASTTDTTPVDSQYGTTSTATTTTTPTATGAPVSYIVTFQDNVPDATQRADITAANGTPGDAISVLSMYSVTFPAGEDAADASTLTANPDVAAVERDQSRDTAAVPNDPSYGSQWSLPQIGWDNAYGTISPGSTATVAVLDTGVDASHADLNGVVVPGRNVIAGTSDTSDDNGHGTEMAGIVAADTNNNEGIAGVGYAGVKVMPVKVLDGNGNGLDSDVINGVVWATQNHANVILMSFSNPGYSSALQSAINYAWSHGVVIVAATGNDGQSTVNYPAGDKGVIGVGSTGIGDTPSSFSNTGADVFLAAPGENILSTSNGGGYSGVTGTSASAAAVAGAAALVKASSPLASNGVIVNRLAESADAAGTASQTGNGRLNLGRAINDTSITSIEPAGAGASGGPFVGPYVAAAGFQATLQGEQCQEDANNHCTGVPVPNSWTASQLVCTQNTPTPTCTGWRELDPIPVRVLLTGGPVTGKVIDVTFTHTKTNGGTVTQGIESLTSFVAGSGVTITNGPTLTAVAGQDTWDVSFTVNVTGTADTAVTFTAKMSAGAHAFGGSSLAMGGTPSLGNLQVHVPAPAPGSPDLKLTKSVDSTSAAPNSTLTYTLGYQNLTLRHDGSAGQAATGAQIIDTLPANVTYASGCTAAVNCTTFGSPVSELRWSLGNLGVGASGTRTFAVTINSGVSNGTSITNSGTIASAETEFFGTDNTATATTTVAAVTSTTTGVVGSPNPSTYGQSVTFTATVSPTPSGGTVNFTEGATTLCANVALSGGQATCSTSALTATGSPHSITATYSGVSGSTSYGGSNGTVSQIVNPKNLTVSGLAASNKVYDGNTTATLNTTSAALVGVVSGDNVTLNKASATGAFADKNVGTNKTVQISGLTISGTSSGNYTLTQPTTTANITAKDVTGSFTAANKTYDGTTAATITGRSITGGVIGTETVTLTGGTASFGTKDVGTGKTVTGTGFVLGGAGAGNYVLNPSTLTTTANITARPVTIKASNQSKTYGDTFTFAGTEFTIDSATPMVAGESVASVTLTSPGAAAAATVAGSPYTITPSAAVFAAGTSASNYVPTYTTGLLTVTPREASVAYIGQTAFFTSGSSSTTAQVTLTASVADTDGSGGNVTNATVTFKDLITGTVLASGVKVAAVSNSDTHTGTANTIVTLSSGQYGAQEYLIEVTLNGSYKNTQQTTAATDSAAYKAAHPTIAVMVPSTINSTQGTTALTAAAPAGKYGKASSAAYALGMKYNKGGSNPQGQIQLILQVPAGGTVAPGTYYVKSNSITSLAFTNALATNSSLPKDVTIYTKASIYLVNPGGGTTSVDGNVTLRVDGHEGCITSPSCTTTGDGGDKIGFTVISSKDSSLYYSNNWVYDSNKLAWATVMQSMSPFTAIIIN